MTDRVVGHARCKAVLGRRTASRDSALGERRANHDRKKRFMDTHMRRAIKLFTAIGIAAAGGGAALARTNPGLAGQPQAPSDYPCFTNGAGSVQNSCANTVKSYCMALPVESSSHRVLVSGFSPNNTHTLACQAVATDRFSNVTDQSGLLPTPAFNAFSIIDLGTRTVPPSGALFVCCSMPDTSLLLTVTW